MKVTIVLLFLAQCFAAALCAPVEQPSKSVQWIDTDARDELENDIDNLIEPEGKKTKCFFQLRPVAIRLC